MSRPLLIKNARIVNERSIIHADVRIKNQRIDKIAPEISAQPHQRVIDIAGSWLIPGMIDDQVHFQTPGVIHKGSIFTESRAAVIGGITSFMETSNGKSNVTSLDAIDKKAERAALDSFGNYAFYLDASSTNIEDIKRLNPHSTCGVRVCIDSMLHTHQDSLDTIFKYSPTLVFAHGVDGNVVNGNLHGLKQDKSALTIHDHPRLCNDEASFKAITYVVDLAKQYNTQLHVSQVSSAKDLALFEPGPVKGKHITAATTAQHLWFTNDDYGSLGNLIKCTPSIKSSTDKEALFKGLHDQRINVIATDHNPHTFKQKQVGYIDAPAGLPIVQDALLSLLEHTVTERLSILDIVENVSHNPAIRYGIKDRGFVKEGYFADLVVISDEHKTSSSDSHTRYRCGWTPFHGVTFSHKVMTTIVNGDVVYDGKSLSNYSPALPLEFIR